jgi:ribonuclease T1
MNGKAMNDAGRTSMISARRRARAAVLITLARAALAALCLLAFSLPPAAAFSPGTDHAATVDAQSLPREAREVLDQIRHGGPFLYPHKDGSVFSNRERVLPQRPRGFYCEYTVPTPGARDRGARRIITGADVQARSAHDLEFWYTDDHYRSFRRITGVERPPARKP